jgi:hypothetical protein
VLAIKLSPRDGLGEYFKKSNEFAIERGKSIEELLIFNYLKGEYEKVKFYFLSFAGCQLNFYSL